MKTIFASMCDEQRLISCTNLAFLDNLIFSQDNFSGTFLMPPPAAFNKKGKFLGDTWEHPNWGPANPGKDATLPAPSLLEVLGSKIRDDSCRAQ
jgi:hypothetical protein